jgi:hypothetical protein
MTRLKGCHLVAAASIVAATIFSFPAAAQPLAADLESLVGPSLEVGPGLQLARRQIGETDLLGALATLERVQIGHPEALTPRVLYVSLLCRLDDREGAEVELGALAGQAIAEPDWAEVTAACGNLPRPRAERRR